ncbi:hypothetical protein KSF_054880 [Reticulibacter mediterranei]|uniref:Uncharacterized protein n=1 Tax=Reticulibacter mediterranei TaxID=2778369 RepID=A0A8J3N4K8_9CHLR|nr:hypothetical protein [Reticulibacter mediterranei]GHO95440.1 hypothetical protein KSF_054880 [Reticulibacter mediterranei]
MASYEEACDDPGEMFDDGEGGMPMLEVGMRVRILVPFEDGGYREGIIYECCPGRPWPWHVLVDGWSEKWGGIAFAGEELEAPGWSVVKRRQ